MGKQHMPEVDWDKVFHIPSLSYDEVFQNKFKTVNDDILSGLGISEASMKGKFKEDKSCVCPSHILIHGHLEECKYIVYRRYNAD